VLFISSPLDYKSRYSLPKIKWTGGGVRQSLRAATASLLIWAVEKKKKIFGRVQPSAIRVILFYLGRKGEAQIKFLSELLNLE
jgi:hypothetical protein